MQDKDFWEDFMKTDTFDKGTVTPTADLFLPHTDTAKEKADIKTKTDFDLSAILEDIRKRTETTDKTLEQPPTVSPPPSKEPDDADDRQLMRDILAQMKELTEEIRLARQQTDLKPVITSKADSCLMDKPPGIAEAVAVSDEVPITEIDKNKHSPPTKKKKAVTVISNIMFYIIIATIVFGAFLLRSAKNGKPMMIGGYSAMTVLTGSMEDVYPQGSLIITKTTDTDKLKIGDDITFMTGESSSITHRIIGITENYADTGERGFETQGVMNSKPDKDIVAAENVVGRVIFCSKILGDIAAFITKNWPFLLFVVGVMIALLTFLEWNAKKAEKAETVNTEKIATPKPSSHTKRRQKNKKKEEM